MAETVNQAIADRLTERDVQTRRVETQLRREAWAVLALLEADILAVLKLVDPTQYALLARRRQEVEQLMAEEIDPLIQARYAQLATMLDDAMMRLATQEAAVVQHIVNTETDEEMWRLCPLSGSLRAGVVHGLFPSATTPTDLSDHGPGLVGTARRGLSQRVGDSLMVGVSLEESLVQLTQRVRGTAELGLQDGLMGKARQDASRLLATQTTNALGEARVAVAARNAPQLMLVHHSILDSRTSTICISRNGLKYTSDTHEPIGHSIPYLSGVPYHPLVKIAVPHSVEEWGACD